MAGSGRRSRARSDDGTGRYVRSTGHDGASADIAFDATLRAAAPRQYGREKGGPAIAIESPDIRQKVREKKIGNTIMFVVDSSGSMGAQRRMVETKAAVLSLLMDAYRKRDRVGLTAFKGKDAEVLLEPTSSVELADRRLRVLPTGGKSPLSKGLLAGLDALRREKRKHPRSKPFLFVISDGRANAPMDASADPFTEAMDVAAAVRAEGIRAAVIDTETGALRLGRLPELSEAMGAKYYRLADIRGDLIHGIVDGITGESPGE